MINVIGHHANSSMDAMVFVMMVDVAKIPCWKVLNI